MPRRRGGSVAVLAAALSLLAAGSASASPYVHAHRGGPLETSGGKLEPRFAENTLPAFEAAAAAGYVLELDVKLTRDDVPVVIHDATLDRTTDCTGLVREKTLAEIRDCRVDVLGTDDTTAPAPAGERTGIPTMKEVLDLANRRGALLNLEIKNVPTDADFEPGPDFANTVKEAILASGFPPSRLIVQSFFPANLDAFEGDPRLAFAQTSLLTLQQLNEGGPEFADSRGYEWVSPAWPIDPSGSAESAAAYVSKAHSLGLQVVPYTLDAPAQVKDATAAGVDAIISNSPEMARRAVAEVYPDPPAPPGPPTDRECERAAAQRTVPPIEAYERDRDAPRVFAMQFKQELRHVRTYRTFRTKIECMIREYVVPRLAKGRPNIVAFNEDVGLMTLATGSRGRVARETFESGAAPGCEGAPAPCGVAVALSQVTAGYSKEVSAYQSRFGPASMRAISSVFVAGTDTFARGWMQLFSDMARRYDVYILGSNNQAPFRESIDPADIAAFQDPDHPAPESVYVATAPRPYNEVFMWAPHNVRREGPAPLRNVVAQNKKVPLTDIERAIQLEAGPSTGADAIENLRPYRVPGTEARISFATSLPAFIYDGNAGSMFGEPLDPGIDPCSDTARYYMRCMDALGANLVMQDEANPGIWSDPAGEGTWQPLEWMRSTWRAVADPTVRFDYNVTPHLVGNLADLPFDGQTAITQRGLRGGAGCTYVGNTEFMPDPPENDPPRLRPYAGKKREFIAIVPWVVSDRDRDELRAVGDRLAPGSGDELENDYVESAIAADLPFPPQARRESCVGPAKGGGRGSGCANEVPGSRGRDRLRGTARGDLIAGRRGNDRLRGLGGGDCLRGGSGRDRVAGGGGDDEIRLGTGRDRALAGAGDDRIRALRGARDRLRCGAGDDVVSAGRRDRVARSCERVRGRKRGGARSP